LIDAQPAVRGPPAIKALLRDAKYFAHLRDGLPLCQPDLGLAQPASR
jgi:hypothetical protein